MPRPSKYSLTAVLDHRERGATNAAATLGDRVRAREAAALVALSAKSREMAALAAACDAREAERARLGEGALRAGDLAQAAQWELAKNDERAALAAMTSAAEAKRIAATDEEASARVALARSASERDAMRDHRDAHRAGIVGEREAAEDEEAADVRRARR